MLPVNILSAKDLMRIIDQGRLGEEISSVLQ